MKIIHNKFQYYFIFIIVLVVSILSNHIYSKEVTFSYYDPEATIVDIFGDINNQSQTLEMENNNGTWTLTINLTPGQHNYVFLVDFDKWINDPKNPNIDKETNRSLITIDYPDSKYKPDNINNTKNSISNNITSNNIHPLFSENSKFSSEKPSGLTGGIVVGGTSTSGKNRLSFSLGGSSIFLDNLSTKNNIYQVPLGVTYGLNDNCDISLTIPTVFLKLPNYEISGLGKIALSAKNWYIGEIPGDNMLGTTFTFLLPTGNKNIFGAEQNIDMYINTNYEKKYRKVSFNMAFNINIADISKGNNISYSAGAAFAIGLLDNLGTSIEILSSFSNNGNPAVTIFNGWKFGLTRSVAMNILIGRNLQNNEYSMITTSGLSVCF